MLRTPNSTISEVQTVPNEVQLNAARMSTSVLTCFNCKEPFERCAPHGYKRKSLKHLCKDTKTFTHVFGKVLTTEDFKTQFLCHHANKYCCPKTVSKKGAKCRRELSLRTYMQKPIHASNRKFQTHGRK